MLRIFTAWAHARPFSILSKAVAMKLVLRVFFDGIHAGFCWKHLLKNLPCWRLVSTIDQVRLTFPCGPLLQLPAGEVVSQVRLAPWLLRGFWGSTWAQHIEKGLANLRIFEILHWSRASHGLCTNATHTVHVLMHSWWIWCSYLFLYMTRLTRWFSCLVQACIQVRLGGKPEANFWTNP